MTTLKFNATNWMGLEALEITSECRHLIVGGSNAVGKSSLLTGCAVLLSGNANPHRLRTARHYWTNGIADGSIALKLDAGVYRLDANKSAVEATGRLPYSVAALGLVDTLAMKPAELLSALGARFNLESIQDALIDAFAPLVSDEDRERLKSGDTQNLPENVGGALCEVLQVARVRFEGAGNPATAVLDFLRERLSQAKGEFSAITAQAGDRVTYSEERGRSWLPPHFTDASIEELDQIIKEKQVGFEKLSRQALESSRLQPLDYYTAQINAENEAIAKLTQQIQQQEEAITALAAEEKAARAEYENTSDAAIAIEEEQRAHRLEAGDLIFCPYCNEEITPDGKVPAGYEKTADEEAKSQEMTAQHLRWVNLQIQADEQREKYRHLLEQRKSRESALEFNKQNAQKAEANQNTAPPPTPEEIEAARAELRRYEGARNAAIFKARASQQAAEIREIVGAGKSIKQLASSPAILDKNDIAETLEQINRASIGLGEITLADDFTPQINGRPLLLASMAEKHLVRVALQMCAAVESRAAVVIIDGFDIFAAEYRRPLLLALGKIAESIKARLIVGATMKPKANPPELQAAGFDIVVL